VMLCFDSGSRPSREVLSRGSRAWGCARVHIFDWGRSELNTAAMHARLEEDKKVERQKYWGYYCGAVAKLLYDCCNLYVSRFWHAKKSLAFTVWDKDKNFMPDDFIGACVIPLAEAGGQHRLSTWKGDAVTKGMLRATKANLSVSVKPMQPEADSRLRDFWAVKVHSADNLPRKDTLSPNDTFVEVTALPDKDGAVTSCLESADAQKCIREKAHVTTLAVDVEAPVWEEEFEIATLAEGAQLPFYRALSTALGMDSCSPTAMEAKVAELFPCHPSKAPSSAEVANLEAEFVEACVPGLEFQRQDSTRATLDT